MDKPNHFKLESSHLESIKALAEEIDRTVEEVNDIYSSAFKALKSNARVQDYLAVLASKKVRDELRH